MPERPPPRLEIRHPTRHRCHWKPVHRTSNDDQAVARVAHDGEALKESIDEWLDPLGITKHCITKKAPHRLPDDVVLSSFEVSSKHTSPGVEVWLVPPQIAKRQCMQHRIVAT